MTKYTRELLEPLAKKNVSVAGVLRDLGLVQVGGIHTHISKLLRKFEINTTHFTGSATNSGASHTGGPIKKTWREILILTGKDQRVPAFRLRRALIEMGRPYLCQDCQGPLLGTGRNSVFRSSTSAVSGRTTVQRTSSSCARTATAKLQHTPVALGSQT